MGGSADTIEVASIQPRPFALPLAPLPRSPRPPHPAPRARPRRPLLDLLTAIRLEDGVQGTPEAQLAEAVRMGQDHLARRLVTGGARANWVDSEGKSTLRHAVEGRRAALVSLLLQQGARVESGLLATALRDAGYLEGLEVAHLLLPRTTTTDLGWRVGGRTALAWAAVRGDLELVGEMLERGASPWRLGVAETQTTTEVVIAPHDTWHQFLLILLLNSPRSPLPGASTAWPAPWGGDQPAETLQANHQGPAGLQGGRCRGPAPALQAHCIHKRIVCLGIFV